MSIVSTVGGIIEEAATRLNEVSADEQDVYLTWLNFSLRDIAIDFPNAPFLFASADRTLSAGIRQYTNLPSNYDRMVNVTYPTGDVKLKYLTEEEFAVVQPSAAETGTPMVYTIHGAVDMANSQLEFYPVPGSAITINYKYRFMPAVVSATSVVPQIPLKYYELPVLYIEMKGLRRREDYSQADATEVKYETLKDKMKSDFKRRTEEPWRIKSIREFTQANRVYGNEIVDLFWGDNN